MDNNRTLYSCEFASPTKCHMNFFSAIIDFSHLRKINCQNEKPSFDTVQEMWKNHLSYKELGKLIESFEGLVFPLTNNENFTFNKFKSEKDFSNKVKENILFFKEPSEAYNSNSEVKLYKNDESFDIDINLQYNQSLSNIRNKIIKEKNKDNKNINTNKNILFIYIDSLSRSHFYRKMVSVSKFLEKYHLSNLNENNQNANYESFQFFKYQTFKKDYQISSIQGMFYNQITNQNPISNAPYKNIHILSYLKKSGYVTGQSANICSKEFYSYDLEEENEFFKYAEIEEYDHENIAMFCDPFYFEDDEDKESYRKNVKGINSSIKRCIYGKNSFEYVLDYGYQFWFKYKNNAKFLRLGFFDGNEKTGEVIKYLDSFLYDFLEKLFNENMLENTVLFIASGQGNVYDEFFNNYNYEDFFIEKYIGALFIFIDKKNINSSYYNLNNIRNNQQVMITPYDIKETLESIAGNKLYNEMKDKEQKTRSNSKKGKSLFRYINPKERNCEIFKLNEEICRCNDF